MSSKTQKKGKKKIIFQRGALPFLGVAAAIFIVTVAFYFLFDRLSAGVDTRDSVTDWEYTYSDTVEVVYNDSMRIYNSQNPIVTGDQSHEYIYFVRSFEGVETDRVLTILTDHSPIRIFVSGYEVYNNHFSGEQSEQYVGNCYNSIVLEGNERDVQVEVLMRLPFSVRFEASIADGSSIPAFVLSTTVILMGALAALCFIALIISLLICAKRHRMSRLPVGFALLLIAALADILMNLMDCTYYLNDPIWVNICAAVMFSIPFIAVLMVSGVTGKKTKLNIITVILWAIGVASIMIFSEPQLFLAMCEFSSVLAAICAFLLTAEHYLALVSRTQYASGLFVSSGYYTFCILAAGIFFCLRRTGLFTFIVIVSTAFAAATMVFIDSATFRLKEQEKLVEQTSIRHGECVDKLAAFIRRMLSSRNRDELLLSAPGEVAALVRAYYGEDTEIYYCAAVKEGTEYRELLSEGVDHCNYPIIEGNCRREMRSCLFFGSYFDYSFGSDNGRVLFHFEGIDCIRDQFFTDMLESAYSGLETAIQNIDHADAEDGAHILLKLAAKAEEDDGYNADHLEYVSAMAKMLAIGSGIDEHRAEEIAEAAKFHDIGKLAIPRSITTKEGRLSPEERAIVSEHTDYGYKILSAFSDDERFGLAAVIARYHHERFDGTGKYKLEGEDIPLEARIVAICDVFDALTTPRRYKRQWSVKEAMSFVSDGKDTLFDPELVSVFKELGPQIKELKNIE